MNLFAAMLACASTTTVEEKETGSELADTSADSGVTDDTGASSCTSLIDDVPAGSMGATWNAADHPDNPEMTWEEVEGGYSETDGTRAIRATAIGVTESTCRQEAIYKNWPLDLGANFATLDARAYFTCSMQGDGAYNGTWLAVEPLSLDGTSYGVQRYYLPECVASWPLNDPTLHPLRATDELNTWSIDLSHFEAVGAIGSVTIGLISYACIGENEATLDHVAFEACAD